MGQGAGSILYIFLMDQFFWILHPFPIPSKVHLNTFMQIDTFIQVCQNGVEYQVGADIYFVYL